MAMQQADAAAEPGQEPKEAVPPWLARQQPNLADLFGGSSSDEEQAQQQAAKTAARRAGEALPGKARLKTDSSKAFRTGVAADFSAGGAQAAVSAAGNGLSTSALQPEVPNPAPTRITQRNGKAGRPAIEAIVTPAKRMPGMNHSAVAQQLEQDLSGSEQPPALGLLSGIRTDDASQQKSQNRGSKRRDPWKPVVLEDYNDEEEGNTPKFGVVGTDPWDAAVSDKDARRATPGASSSESDGPQPSSTSAARQRGAGRHQNGGQNTAQASTGAAQEAKKSSIHESLKQALAAQVRLTVFPHSLLY